MATFEKSIREHQAERIRSICYQFMNQVELTKGIAEELGYSGMEIHKLGSEIKSKIKQDLDRLMTSKYDLSQTLEILKKKAGADPTVSIKDDYSVRDYIKVLPYIPNKYDHSQVYREDPNMPLTEEEKQKIAAMAKYNQLVRKYVDTCIDTAKLNTVVDNLEDKKKYKLSTTIATKLGF